MLLLLDMAIDVTSTIGVPGNAACSFAIAREERELEALVKVRPAFVAHLEQGPLSPHGHCH
jgi:hypothetical protein